jgi:YcxB-like protein
MGNAVALRYELKLDDLVGFNKFHFRASLRFWRWVVIIVGLMVIVSLGLKRDWSLEAQNLLGSIVVGCLVFIVLSKGPVWNGLIKIQVKRLYGKGAHPGLIGPHKITVSDQGVVEESEVGNHRVNWKGIVKVESSDTHAYIYIGAVQAHVIPKASVIEGDYDAFVAQSKEWFQRKCFGLQKF